MNQEIHDVQNCYIYERQRAHLSGIDEVESFTDTEIVALSSLGKILIEGEDLHIDAFSTENKELEIHGRINSLLYLDRENTAKKGFFSRMMH